MKKRPLTGIFSGSVLLCLLCAAGSAVSQCLTSNDARPLSSKNTQKILYASHKDFSLKLLAEINKRQSKSENVFLSPYSIYHSLMMAYFISSNHTEEALSKTLGFYNKDKVDVLQAYKLDKNRRQDYEFSNANRIYIATQVEVRECMVGIFNEELQQLNFKKDPLAALQTINGWVENKTRGMISNLLPADAVDHDTNLVLVNAAYFKGRWKYRFQPENTHEKIFYISKEENTFVDMMMQEGTFNHDVSEKLGAHVLELPYEGSASMFILLPPFTGDNNVETVLSRLNSETLEDIVNDTALISRKVEVQFPRFAVERTIELGPVLESLNIGDLLQSTADLSTILAEPSKQRISLGRAIHKARLEVNEEGTEAAAATSIFTFRSGRPIDTQLFYCNHPFIYFIYEHRKKAILFAGIFRRPPSRVGPN